MNWDSPEERLALLESVGLKEYNRRFEEHKKKSVVATVNGHEIRPVVYTVRAALHGGRNGQGLFNTETSGRIRGEGAK